MTVKKMALLLLALSLSTCNQAIMVAPPGSNMFIEANPRSIAAHGDVSVITVQLIKGTGQPVADGTVVQFFTSLGSIDEQAKTNDGVARVNLISDSRSGTAHVTAVSGGEATTTPSPSPTTASQGSPVEGVVSAMSVSGASALSTTAGPSATIDVIIGTGRLLKTVVTALPQKVSPTRPAQIVAFVFDDAGNPVANVPVIFTIDGGTGTETLDSQGRPVFTDTNGQATDVLRTRAVMTGTVTVTATPSNGTAATTPSIAVNPS